MVEIYNAPEESDHCEIELKDGRRLERYSSSLRGEDDQYLGRIWCFRDITERKRTEIELANSEQRFRRFFEDNGSFMVVIDPEEGKILDANQAALDFYGYSRKQFLSMYTRDISVVSAEELRAYVAYFSLQNLTRNVFIDRADTLFWQGVDGAPGRSS